MAKKRKKVSFSVQADGAKDVVLTGEFTGWAPDRMRLGKGAGGVWRGVLELAPGDYQYRLIVDGEWRDHPAAAKRIDNPFGTKNCILTVS